MNRKPESGWEIKLEEYKMELFAPTGFRFEDSRNGMHSFVEWRHKGVSDKVLRQRLIDRAKVANLWPCSEDCECKA